MLWVILGLISITVVLVRSNGLRAWVYDRVIVAMTTEWYHEVLKSLPENIRLLDIGIGTGTALLAPKNLKLLEEKDIYIVGVDYDEDYVQECKRKIQKLGVDHRVKVVHKSIYDYSPSDPSEAFDFIYFSGSFMILPDPKKALLHCRANLFRPSQSTLDRKIIITQTFELQRRNYLSRLLLSFGKSVLRLLSSIDFGKVTYADEFEETIHQSGMYIDSTREIPGPRLFRGKSRAFRFLTLKYRQ